MKCTSPVTVHGNSFNCGRCHACRVNYTSMWTLRLLYELSNWSAASFVTLTYDDEHLPNNGSLNPKDLTDFWKRLRKNLVNEYHDGRKIKYYACGEYGDRTKRPHYHAIIFGLDNYSDLDRQILIDSWSKCDPLRFDKNLKKSGMLPVCREDIAYVCGYVQKKLSGELAEKEYGDKVRPFSRVSNGMGLDFAYEHQERLCNNGFTYLNSKKIALPRYFRDKLGVSQKELIKSKKTLAQYERENQEIFKLFEKEMKQKNTWYPENTTMMAIRFERWYDDFNFTLSRMVERDFNQLKKIKGGYV